MLGALAQGGQGHVDGDVAAADDGDPRPHLHGVAAAHGAQEVDAAQHEGPVDAVDGDEAGPLGAQAEEHGVVVGAEGVEAADGGAGVDLDAEGGDLAEFLVEQVGGQAVGGDAVAQHPAGVVLGLEDLDVVSVGAQVVGGGQAGGTGADDTDPLAGVGRQVGSGVAAVGQAVQGGGGFQGPDEQRAVAAAAHAGGLARRRADQAAHQRQGVVLPDDFDGGPIVAVAEMGHEAGDVDVGRAGAVTRRRAPLEAHPFRAGLAPGVVFPLLAVVAQGAAQRPGPPQALGGQLEGHLVEGGQMGGVAATETDLADQAGRSGQQGPDR